MYKNSESLLFPHSLSPSPFSLLFITYLISRGLERRRIQSGTHSWTSVHLRLNALCNCLVLLISYVRKILVSYFMRSAFTDYRLQIIYIPSYHIYSSYIAHLISHMSPPFPGSFSICHCHYLQLHSLHNFTTLQQGALIFWYSDISILWYLSSIWFFHLFLIFCVFAFFFPSELWF